MTNSKDKNIRLFNQTARHFLNSIRPHAWYDVLGNQLHLMVQQQKTELAEKLEAAHQQNMTALDTSVDSLQRSGSNVDFSSTSGTGKRRSNSVTDLDVLDQALPKDEIKQKAVVTRLTARILEARKKEFIYTPKKLREAHREVKRQSSIQANTMRNEMAGEFLGSDEFNTEMMKQIANFDFFTLPLKKKQSHYQSVIQRYMDRVSEEVEALEMKAPKDLSKKDEEQKTKLHNINYGLNLLNITIEYYFDYEPRLLAHKNLKKSFLGLRKQAAKSSSQDEKGIALDLAQFLETQTDQYLNEYYNLMLNVDNSKDARDKLSTEYRSACEKRVNTDFERLKDFQCSEGRQLFKNIMLGIAAVFTVGIALGIKAIHSKVTSGRFSLFSRDTRLMGHTKNVKDTLNKFARLAMEKTKDLLMKSVDDSTETVVTEKVSDQTTRENSIVNHKGRACDENGELLPNDAWVQAVVDETTPSELAKTVKPKSLRFEDEDDFKRESGAMSSGLPGLRARSVVVNDG